MMPALFDIQVVVMMGGVGSRRTQGTVTLSSRTDATVPVSLLLAERARPICCL